MESRLSVLAAAQLIVLATTGVARAGDHKALARELFDLGIEEYTSHAYSDAASSMAKSYELDPQPAALYAEAQAERLAGDCKAATKHYQQLLDTAKDEKTTAAVKSALELCEQLEHGEQPEVEHAEDPKAVARRDAPTIQIRTVYRTEKHSDAAVIAMFAAGGIALGGSVTTYVLARSTRSDANHAQSLAEYNDLYDRSTHLRWVSYASAGAGVVLVGLATWRVLRGKPKAHASAVAMVPIRGGSLVSWATRW